jgi:hypothetical protein
MNTELKTLRMEAVTANRGIDTEAVATVDDLTGQQVFRARFETSTS